MHKNTTSEIQCTFCNKTFENQWLMKFHEQALHKGRKIIKCEKCDKYFHSEEALQRHFKFHNENLCVVCEQTFENIWVLKFHKQAIHPTISNNIDPLAIDDEEKSKNEESNIFDKNIKFSCKHCKIKFTNQDDLLNHISLKHGKSKSMFNKCKICVQDFVSIQALVQHFSVEHSKTNSTQVPGQINGSDLKPNENISEQFECAKCSKKFEGKHRASVHMREAHRMSKIQVFRFHEKIQNPGKSTEERKNFVKSTQTINKSRKQSLRNYSKPQTEIKPKQRNFHCPVCQKISRDKISFNNHIKYFHEKISLKLLCKYCPWKGASIATHMKENHSEKITLDCKICGYVFTSEKDLKKHILCHSKIKDNFCSICDYSSLSRGNLRYHMRQKHRLSKSKVYRMVDEIQ